MWNFQNFGIKPRNKVFDSLKATGTLYNGPVWFTLFLKKKKKRKRQIFLSWKYYTLYPSPGWGICCTHTFLCPFAWICFPHCTVGNNDLPLKLKRHNNSDNKRLPLYLSPSFFCVTLAVQPICSYGQDIMVSGHSSLLWVEIWKINLI